MRGRYLLGLSPLKDVESFVRRQTHLDIDYDRLVHLDQESRRVRSIRLQPKIVPPEPLGEECRDHLRTLQSRPLFRRLFMDKEKPFPVYWVDIPSLIPVQPHVSYDFALGLTYPGMSTAEILDLCLPAKPEPLAVWGGVTAAPKTDAACTILTHDLNVLVSAVSMTTDQGLRVTFSIGKTAVFCQVQESGGRFYLKDGTHRAVSLLARGIRKMPCVVEMDVAPQSLVNYFPPGVLANPRPPSIWDFLDPVHYLEYPWEERTKIIRIKADEFVAPG